MNIDPGWEQKIVCYLYLFTWYTPESVRFERAKGTKLLVNANPYTWSMLVNRAQRGGDVPSWLTLHIEGELKLRLTA